MPITGGPYLASAFFCERVLREQDGVLSIIRIVDRWNVTGPTPNIEQPLIVQTTLVVLIKSGIFRGPAQLRITPISPSNARMESIVLTTFFEADDDRGTGIVLPIGFPVKEDGVYWFEVALAGQNLQTPQVLTYMPMRVVYLQVGTTRAPGSNPPNPMSGADQS